MDDLQISHQGTDAYGSAVGMIMNANNQWRKVIRDSKDGKSIVNNAGTLRHEDHQRIMQQLVEIRRRELNGILDLMNAGLSSSESMSTQLVGLENINEFQPAKRDMNPTNFQSNQSDFSLVYTPLPITHQSWRIPLRQLGFGYKRSIGLSESVRQVSESLEDMLFNGDSKIKVKVGSADSIIEGYTNAANRAQVTITDWTNLAVNRVNIIPDTLKMVSAAFVGNASSRPNSLVMYVANDIWTNLQDDYSLTHGGSNTIADRIKKISQIVDVKPAEKMAAGEVLLVELSDRTVELSLASDIVTIPHIRSSDLDDQTFTTYAVMVPILKNDRNDKMGIVHGTT